MISDGAVRLAEIFQKRKITLSLAESCTGGMISKFITDVPGASDFFLGCAVTYSNASKEKLLNVPRKTLEAHGAVSKEVAEAMAIGCKELFGSAIGASATGIAGPGGGTPSKPVGTVFIAVTDGRTTKSERLELKGTRDEIRKAASENVIRIILEFTG